MDRPKQLPRPVPMQGNVHQSVRYEQRQKIEQKNRSILASMAAWVGGGGLFGVLDEIFGRHVEKMGRRGFTVSRRSAEHVLQPVRRFYRQRPRPWCSPNARARLARVARRRSKVLAARRAANGLR